MVPQNLTSPLYKASFIAVLNVSSVLNISMFPTFWKQDRNIFKKVSAIVNYPLLPFLPRIKSTHYNLRRKSSGKPKNNTVHSMRTHVNRLVFKYNLALE